MTIRLDGDTAWLEGACGVAEAEPLFAALRAGRVKVADLSACRQLHGAIAETLLQFRVLIRGEATDPFLRDFVAPALERQRTRALAGQTAAAAGSFE